MTSIMLYLRKLYFHFVGHNVQTFLVVQHLPFKFKVISFPGISAFLRSISVEAIGLGVHLAAGAHDILLQAEYMVSNSAPSVPRPIPSKMQTNVRSNQPKDAQQGIQQVTITHHNF